MTLTLKFCTIYLSYTFEPIRILQIFAYLSMLSDSRDVRNVEENQKSSIDPNLYLYDDDLETRPHISTFISSIANYENTIPAATDPDAKPPPPSARMGMLTNYKFLLARFILY